MWYMATTIPVNKEEILYGSYSRSPICDHSANKLLNFYSMIMRAERFPFKIVHVQNFLLITNHSNYNTSVNTIDMPKK